MMEKVMRGFALFLGVVFLGGLSGRMCGFIILSFSHLTGNSGTTGTEYFGYWEPEFCWWWAGWIGQPLGVIAAPIVCFGFLWSTPMFKTWAVLMLGTIISGCIGALAGPIGGAVLGFGGFCAACICLVSWQMKPGKCASTAN